MTLTVQKYIEWLKSASPAITLGRAPLWRQLPEDVRKAHLVQQDKGLVTTVHQRHGEGDYSFIAQRVRPRRIGG